MGAQTTLSVNAKNDRDVSLAGSGGSPVPAPNPSQLSVTPDPTAEINSRIQSRMEETSTAPTRTLPNPNTRSTVVPARRVRYPSAHNMGTCAISAAGQTAPYLLKIFSTRLNPPNQTRTASAAARQDQGG